MALVLDPSSESPCSLGGEQPEQDSAGQGQGKRKRVKPPQTFPAKSTLRPENNGNPNGHTAENTDAMERSLPRLDVDAMPMIVDGHRLARGRVRSIHARPHHLEIIPDRTGEDCSCLIPGIGVPPRPRWAAGPVFCRTDLHPPSSRAACGAKYVRTPAQPARLKACSVSRMARSSSSQPLAIEARIIAYSPETW